MPAPDLPGRPGRLRRGVAAAAPGMRRVGDITHAPARRGSAHPAVVVDCIPGKGSSGARSPVACAPGSSPGPWPWPYRARPPIRGVRVLHSGRGARCTSAGCTGFMAGRGVLPSVGRTGSCYQRGLEEGTREPWGPLGPGPCDPGDSPDRVTMRSQASPLGDRPPDPRPSRHRMETTAQGSSPRPTINHCLKNPYHSSLLLDCFWSRINHLGTGRPSSSATRLSEVTDNSSDQPYEIRLNVDAVRDAIEVDDSSIPLRGCGFWGLAPCGLLVGGRPSRGSSAAVGASGGALVGRGVCSGS